MASVFRFRKPKEKRSIEPFRVKRHYMNSCKWMVTSPATAAEMEHVDVMISDSTRTSRTGDVDTWWYERPGIDGLGGNQHHHNRHAYRASNARTPLPVEIWIYTSGAADEK